MTKMRLARAGVCLLALALLGACGDSSTPTGPGSSTGTGTGTASTSGDAPAALKVANLIKQAGPAVADPKTTVCPIAYDMSAAAKAATLNGSVTPVDSSPVTAEVSTPTSGTTTMKSIAPAVAIQCDYQVGTTEVMTYVLAATKADSALAASLPQIAFYSEPAGLAEFLTTAQAAKKGVPVIRKSGKAGIVRLDVSDGDGALAVGIDPVDGVSAEQLTALIEALAIQVR